MSRTGRIVLALAAIIAAHLWGNYCWYRGFDAGADTALCIMARSVGTPVGIAVADRRCGALRGRSPPWPRI